MLKFTPSEDGVERVTVRVAIRLSRHEVEDIKDRAAANDEDWREWMEHQAALAIETALTSDEDGSFEQRYGKGGD